jgi:hypothetical protein
VVSDELRALYMYLNTKQLPQDIVGKEGFDVFLPRKTPEAVVEAVSVWGRSATFLQWNIILGV